MIHYVKTVIQFQHPRVPTHKQLFKYRIVCTSGTKPETVSTVIVCIVDCNNFPRGTKFHKVTPPSRQGCHGNVTY